MPITAYYKLIDWWLLIIFNALLLTLGFHTYLAYVISKSKKDALNGGITNVHPIINNESEDEEVDKSILMKHVNLMNTVAKVVFLIFLIVFNIIFWSIAIIEHLRPAEYYITEE